MSKPDSLQRRCDLARRSDDMHALWPLYCLAESRSPSIPIPTLTEDELKLARFRFLHYVLQRPWWVENFKRMELVAFCSNLKAEDREPLDAR